MVSVQLGQNIRRSSETSWVIKRTARAKLPGALSMSCEIMRCPFAQGDGSQLACCRVRRCAWRRAECTLYTGGMRSTVAGRRNADPRRRGGIKLMLACYQCNGEWCLHEVGAGCIRLQVQLGQVCLCHPRGRTVVSLFWYKNSHYDTVLVRGHYSRTRCLAITNRAYDLLSLLFLCLSRLRSLPSSRRRGLRLRLRSRRLGSYLPSSWSRRSRLGLRLRSRLCRSS